MTKQEQIEEISNIIAEVAFVQAHEENGDENLSDIVATALYNAGCRIVLKDSVVLTEKEYIDLSRNYVREQIEQARKETAEKILKDFKLWAREYQNKDTVVDENGERLMTNNEKLNYLYAYLCDKYKVKIKE